MRIYSALNTAKASLRGEKVPFQELFPLKVMNRVSNKGDRLSEVCCIHEMSVMLACLKTNDYNQSFCSKEISGFKKCYMDNLNTKNVKKEREEKGILTPGEKKLTAKQMNILLKKYPNVNQ